MCTIMDMLSQCGMMCTIVHFLIKMMTFVHQCTYCHLSCNNGLDPGSTGGYDVDARNNAIASTRVNVASAKENVNVSETLASAFPKKTMLTNETVESLAEIPSIEQAPDARCERRVNLFLKHPNKNFSLQIRKNLR